MATETSGSSKTTINPLLAQQGRFALDEARRLYDERIGQPLPSLYTGMSDQRQEALGQIADLARGGAIRNLVQPEIDYHAKVMSGHYLDPDTNPYLGKIVSDAVGAAGSAPISSAVSGGRFGSGVMANAMADRMQSTAAQLYGQNYQQERDRMNAMLGRGQQLGEGLYADAQRLGAVGSAYEEDQMRQAAEQMRQYQADEQRLNSFLAMMNQNPLTAERSVSSNSTTLDYGAMAAGGAKMMMGGM